ncbi:MAG TPA: hypothetical protein VF576_13270, partial [Rubricoccaceae bacterium]
MPPSFPRLLGQTAALVALTIATLAPSTSRAQRAGFAPAFPSESAQSTARQAGLVGSWWEGTLSTIQFYNPSTGQWAAPNGTGIFLTLYADGTFRAGGILNVTTGYCTSTLMVDERGTYSATGTVSGGLTLARQTGHSRASNTCGTQVYERVLEPETVAYTFALGQDGQGDETLTRSRGGQPHSTMRRWSSTPPPVPNPTVARSYTPGTAQQVFLAETVAPLDTGFVFGSNVYRDRAVASMLRLPLGATQGRVESLRLFYGYKKPGASGLFAVSVHAGNAQTGPVGAPLATAILDMANIRADADLSTPSEPTVLTLSEPAVVGQTFFVKVSVYYDDPIQPNWLVDRVALASSPLRDGRVAETWVQGEDYTWYNASDLWTSSTGTPGTGTAGWDLMVEAHLAGAGTPDEPGAEPADDLALSPVAPNPVRGNGTVQFALGRPSHVAVDVVD